ncbi:MAG: hypothetical protein OQK50_05905 [Deltaproteobacteria bacterium]|jgi:uncharacterized protein (UPF0333 family)|nr:hypothetical protein [Deltaproteobacteria bacterium]MCW9049848.1 hypothetical protein [Deltaproteobacteria bacterium]
MSKDIIKLLVLIIIVGAIILGIYVFGKSIDNKSKYKHPITQKGSGW